MKKYVGIVQVIKEHFSGTLINLYSLYSDDTAIIKKWFELYQDTQTTTVKKIILENNHDTNDFFETFKVFVAPNTNFHKLCINLFEGEKE